MTEADPSKLAGWEGKYLPSGWELTEHLVRTYNYPRDEPLDLLRVSQFVAVTSGTGPLYEELRRLLVRGEHPVTAVHSFLAGLPAAMREQGCRTLLSRIGLPAHHHDQLRRRDGARPTCGR